MYAYIYVWYLLIMIVNSRFQPEVSAKEGKICVDRSDISSTLITHSAANAFNYLHKKCKQRQTMLAIGVWIEPRDL